ncbi:MAG: hypothetical protein ACWA5L_03875 [bacterium]
MYNWVILLLVSGVYVFSPLSAQAQHAKASCQTREYNHFDFWLGQWDVYGLDGALQGRNVISSEENGCLLVERWTSVQGATGQSYNYYNPASDQWRQVWISSSVVIDYSGGMIGEAMVLKGQIDYRQSGKSYPFKGRWTPRDDGTVLQEFWQFNPEAEKWDVWFTGVYRKADQSP